MLHAVASCAALAQAPTSTHSCVASQDVLTNGGKGRADLTNLPRKINICVSPTRDDFPHTHINDLGFQAVKNEAGELRFNVEVGGYFSIKRNATSFPLGISVSEEQVRCCIQWLYHSSCAALGACAGCVLHGTRTAHRSYSLPWRLPRCIAAAAVHRCLQEFAFMHATHRLCNLNSKGKSIKIVN